MTRFSGHGGNLVLEQLSIENCIKNKEECLKVKVKFLSSTYFG